MILTRRGETVWWSNAGSTPMQLKGHHRGLDGDELESFFGVLMPVIPSEDHIAHPVEIYPSDPPRSKLFGDVFFSSAGACAESAHVFVGGSRLLERLEAEHIELVELGFGAGINLLVSAALAREAGVAERLHFTSFERYPLSPPDLERILASVPGLPSIAKTFLLNYRIDIPILEIELEGVRLSIHFSDAPIGIALLPSASVDLWYFDGFTPRSNPELWSESLIAEITRCSRANARVATYSVQGAFRRSLERSGWAIEKRKGYGAKRECLAAKLRT